MAKRCPRCHLVHSDADYVCRRCRVDLATGEPVALKVIKSKSADQVLREKIANSLALPQKLLKFLSAGLDKALARISSPKLQAKASDELENLVYCMECGGEMKPEIVPYYPRKILYPFLGLSFILFALAFLFPLLIITGVLSLASFIVYYRLRQELWLCTECGHYHLIKRKKKRASDIAKTKPGQGIEIGSG